nr:transporter substrate-binding domain-containing protein [Campylobacter hyointestinalis]
MNRVFKFIFALLLMLNLANAKTLIFGSDAEYPPFGYMDEHNKIAGFDIDLVDAISKKSWI